MPLINRSAKPCPYGCGVYVELRDGQLFDAAGPHSCGISKTSTGKPLLLPLNGRIVVETISEEKTPTGLYLPTNAASEQRATIGKVVALPGYVYDDLTEEQKKDHFQGTIEGEEYKGDLRINDVILFGQNSGMLMDVGVGAARRRAIILRESEVLCKVRKADGSPYA